MSRLSPRSASRLVVWSIWSLCVASGYSDRAPAQEPAADPEALLRQLAEKYLPEDALLAAYGSPVAILAQPAMATLPNEVTDNLGSIHFGISPSSVDFAIFCVAFSVDSQPSVGMILYCKEELPATEPFPAIHTEPGSHNGIAYLRAGEDAQPSHCRIDDRTLLVAPRRLLERMLGEKRESQLRKVLATASADSDVNIVADIAALRKVFEHPNVDNEAADVKLPSLSRVANLTDSLQFQFNLRPGAAAKSIMQSQDAARAEELASLLRKLYDVPSHEVVEAMIPANAFHRITNSSWKRQIALFLRPLLPTLEVRVQESRVLTESAIEPHAIPQLLILTCVREPATADVENIEWRAAAAKLRRVGRAIVAYEKEKGHFPLAFNRGPDGRPLLSWRVHLLPYLDEDDLYDKFRLDEPWNSDDNRKLIAEMPAVFEVPELAGTGLTPVLTPYAPFTMMGGETPRTRDQVAGPLNRVTAVVEVDLDCVSPWTRPQDLPVSVKQPLPCLGGFRHAYGIAQFLQVKATGEVLGEPITNDPKHIFYQFIYNSDESQ